MIENAPVEEPLPTQVDPVDLLVATLHDLERTIRDGQERQLDALGIIAHRLYRKPEPEGPATFDLPFTHHLRINVHYIVLTSTAAATVTVRMGLVTRQYVFGNADTRTFPLRIMFDRGINVSLETTAGVVTGYVVGTYE